jgi:hypothetical protein
MKRVIVALLAVASTLAAQTGSSKALLVTPDNYSRAETDRQFGVVVKEVGVGKFHHVREPQAIDKQLVVRGNRDTLYSGAVFDLDAGPVAITLPDAGKRFMSMQVIDQDHYVVAVVYGAGRHTYSKERVGTRYIVAGIRTLVDPGNPQDLRKAQALQDAIAVEQRSPGRFEVPDWDASSRSKVGDALIALAATIPDTRRMFGAKGEVDPVRHLVGAATGWGGNPEKDAMYLTVVPALNDGRTVHRLTVKDVPVDAFWSISVYNSKGYFERNSFDAYTINNLTGKPEADGSIAIQFGGCDGRIPNCLPITPGWNYWVRLYRPRAEILDGRWQFPEVKPVEAS